jgi:hypothetical protein
VLVFPPLDAPRAVFVVAQKRLPEEAPQRGRGTGGAALAPPIEQDDVSRLALLDHQFVYGLHGGYAACSMAWGGGVVDILPHRVAQTTECEGG